MRENKFRSIAAIILMNAFLPMRRQPLFLINTLASPLSFLFLLVVVGVPPIYGIAGGLVLTVLSVGSSLQSDLTHYKADLKYQEMAVASPVKAGTYVTGMALSEFVFAIPGMAAFVVLSVFYGHYIFLGGLVIFGTLVLLWIFASALGFTLATYLSDVRETFMISPLISIFLSVVPPVYYPLAKLAHISPYLVYLAYVTPTTWAANLVQGALGVPGVTLTLTQGIEDVLVLVAAAALLFAIAWKKAKWRET